MHFIPILFTKKEQVQYEIYCIQVRKKRMYTFCFFIIFTVKLNVFQSSRKKYLHMTEFNGKTTFNKNIYVNVK